MAFPPEILNHIFSYCQGRTNKIMKDHIKQAFSIYTNEIKLVVLVNEDDIKIRSLIYIFAKMHIFRQTHFNGEKYCSFAYGRCAYCRKIITNPYNYHLYDGSRDLFCSEWCGELFDY